MRAAFSTRSVGFALLSVAAGFLAALGMQASVSAAPRVGLAPGFVVAAGQEAPESLADAGGVRRSVAWDGGGAHAAPEEATGSNDSAAPAASSIDGRDLDPVLVALVGIALVLFAVALVSGIQLWRARGDGADENRESGLSRKERRRARRTHRAVQAAERKTAREVDKAEKRAAKMAPDPDPGEVAVTAAAASSRKERKAADRQAKAEAKAAAKQSKADAKARGLAPAGASPAAEPGRAARPGGVAPEVGGPAAGGPPGAAEGETGRRSPLFATPPAAPVTAGPFLESLFADDTAPSGPPPAGGDGPGPDDSVGADAAGSSDALIDAAPGVVGPLAPSNPEPTRPERPDPVDVPLPAPVASSAPAVVPPGALAPAVEQGDTPRLDLTELVARQVPPPSGLFGRRRAKRRFRAAEHRHRQLRAINAILDVEPLAPPTAPVRRVLGVSAAASVASAEVAATPPPAALGAGPTVPPEGSPVAGAALLDPASSDRPPGPAEKPAVPWPSEPGGGDPTGAWPDHSSG